MIRKTKMIADKAVEWLEFSLLQPYPEVEHAVFTRKEDARNVIDCPTDKKEQLLQNRARILQRFHDEKATTELVTVHQVHGCTVVQVTDTLTDAASTYADALTTSLCNKALLIKHADCQATIIYDPEHHAASLVHAGWRGSVQNIYKKTIEQMQILYGSNLKNLIACISPSLGPEKAEFQNYKEELPAEFWRFQVTPSYFDFWAISSWQLQESGIAKENIEIAKICTHSNPEDFFSYRRDKTTGRNATALCLRKRSYVV